MNEPTGIYAKIKARVKELMNAVVKCAGCGKPAEANCEKCDVPMCLKCAEKVRGEYYCEGCADDVMNANSADQTKVAKDMFSKEYEVCDHDEQEAVNEQLKMRRSKGTFTEKDIFANALEIASHLDVEIKKLEADLASVDASVKDAGPALQDAERTGDHQMASEVTSLLRELNLRAGTIREVLAAKRSEAKRTRSYASAAPTMEERENSSGHCAQCGHDYPYHDDKGCHFGGCTCPQFVQVPDERENAMPPQQTMNGDEMHRAMELHRSGKTDEKIADELNKTPATIRHFLYGEENANAGKYTKCKNCGLWFPSNSEHLGEPCGAPSKVHVDSDEHGWEEKPNALQAPWVCDECGAQLPTDADVRDHKMDTGHSSYKGVENSAVEPPCTCSHVKELHHYSGLGACEACGCTEYRAEVKNAAVGVTFNDLVEGHRVVVWKVEYPDGPGFFCEVEGEECGTRWKTQDDAMKMARSMIEIQKHKERGNAIEPTCVYCGRTRHEIGELDTCPHCKKPVCEHDAMTYKGSMSCPACAGVKENAVSQDRDGFACACGRRIEFPAYAKREGFSGTVGFRCADCGKHYRKYGESDVVSAEFRQAKGNADAENSSELKGLKEFGEHVLKCERCKASATKARLHGGAVEYCDEGRKLADAYERSNSSQFTDKHFTECPVCMAALNMERDDEALAYLCPEGVGLVGKENDLFEKVACDRCGKKLTAATFMELMGEMLCKKCYAEKAKEEGVNSNARPPFATGDTCVDKHTEKEVTILNFTPGDRAAYVEDETGFKYSARTTDLELKNAKRSSKHGDYDEGTVKCWKCGAQAWGSIHDVVPVCDAHASKDAEDPPASVVARYKADPPTGGMENAVATPSLKERWQEKILRLKGRMAQAGDPADRAQIAEDIKEAEAEFKELGNASSFKSGDRVTCNGYPATVVEVHTGQLSGMVTCRMESGSGDVTVDSSSVEKRNASPVVCYILDNPAHGSPAPVATKYAVFKERGGSLGSPTGEGAICDSCAKKYADKIESVQPYLETRNAGGRVGKCWMCEKSVPTYRYHLTDTSGTFIRSMCESCAKKMETNYPVKLENIQGAAEAREHLKTCMSEYDFQKPCKKCEKAQALLDAERENAVKACPSCGASMVIINPQDPGLIQRRCSKCGEETKGEEGLREYKNAKSSKFLTHSMDCPRCEKAIKGKGPACKVGEEILEKETAERYEAKMRQMGMINSLGYCQGCGKDKVEVTPLQDPQNPKMRGAVRNLCASCVPNFECDGWSRTLANAFDVCPKCAHSDPAQYHVSIGYPCGNIGCHCTDDFHFMKMTEKKNADDTWQMFGVRYRKGMKSAPGQKFFKTADARSKWIEQQGGDIEVDAYTDPQNSAPDVQTPDVRENYGGRRYGSREYQNSEESLARWESGGGKHWYELFKTDSGHKYKGSDAGGYLPAMSSDDAAIEEMERRVHDYLMPDDAKVIKRVK